MKDKLKSPVAILGFGAEGKYALEFLQSQGIKDITIFDENPDTQIPEGIKSQLGKAAFEEIIGFPTIIRSPGVKHKISAIEEAHEMGCLVTSLTKLTLELASDRISAITGTNGKTTTVALIEQILNSHYDGHLIVGGNDRMPVLQNALDHPKKPILMEVSSFQFADLKHSPYIAAVLNITPNHLDWHENLEEYINAKANILRHQKLDDWAILNASNENSAKLVHATPAQQFWINEKRGDNWAIWENGYLKLSFGRQIEHVVYYDQPNVKTHPDNLLFAAAIAKLHFVPVSTIEEQIKLFKGIEHRLEYIKTIKDVHFYNDSSSTSPEAAMTAIDQFIPRKIILLLGGSSKNADFDFLAQKISDEGPRVYLYGDERETLKEALWGTGAEDLIIGEDRTNNFRHIIEEVYKKAKSEDSIVLSPACASFDMFENAKERGKEFKEIVNSL